MLAKFPEIFPPNFLLVHAMCQHRTCSLVSLLLNFTSTFQIGSEVFSEISEVKKQTNFDCFRNADLNSWWIIMKRSCRLRQIQTPAYMWLKRRHKTWKKAPRSVSLRWTTNSTRNLPMKILILINLKSNLIKNHLMSAEYSKLNNGSFCDLGS